MSLIINIKSSEVTKQAKEKIVKKLNEDLKKVVNTLGKGALQHAEKLSRDNLPGGLDSIYRENLYIENLSENIISVGIREEAVWIEKGRKSGFMEELLTRKSGSDVKTSKDGDKYRVIPFEHDTSKKGLSSSGEDLVGELKNFLRKQGVPYSKSRALELDNKGSPRIGKMHSFNIKDMRNKNKKSVQSLSRNLQGVTIFQNMNPRTGKVERNIMTFRVISEKHRGSKWEHPGRQGEEILDQTFKWIQDTWQNQILPELKAKYERK